MEYYPARHWILRWDGGDTVVFHTPPLTITSIVDGVTSVRTIPIFPVGTTHNFQFNSSIRYRF